LEDYIHTRNVNSRINNKATFPTELHRQTAETVKEYFLALLMVDTFLVVNSCARGQAVPESDLDFAVLIHPDTSTNERYDLEQNWQSYSATHPGILHYKQSHHFMQIHLDIIDGNYLPQLWDDGGGPDYFEVEIGNRIAYSAPLGKEGSYFQQLKSHWLPYYDEELRLNRLSMTKQACEYDIGHIPFFTKRGLYFQAFDRLYKAFQEFLQALFIKHKTYPIAYNKWIKEQIVTLLNLPELYKQLPAIISVTNIEGNEVNEKAELLQKIVNGYC
jgi:predicted nucleotidyltransferase